MLVCLYGEMRDALWPERGLSGSTARRAPAVAFLPDQISSGGLQGRPDDRREMRLVIDQEYALGKSHGPD